jgi:hypothetical protein
VKQSFIVDDEEIAEMVTDENNNESDEEDDEDLFDSICARCDNGEDPVMVSAIFYMFE